MRNVTDFTFGVSDYDRYWRHRKGVGDHIETGIHRYLTALVREHVTPGDKILDCGVGPAVYFRNLTPAYEMHGIEFSPEAIELYDFDASKIISFDLNDGLPDYSFKFDAMVAANIIHHLDDPRVFLKAAKERLRSGGKLIIVHPNLVYFKHRLRLLGGKFPKFSTSHRNFIVPAALKTMLELAGFSVVSITGRKAKLAPALFASELFFVCEAG